MKNLNPMELAAGMTDEILEVIYKYEEAVLVPTVIGILEVIKHELIYDHHQQVIGDQDDD